MKLLVKTCLSLFAFTALATPASACCLFPFGGGWGAGYNAAPAYSSYYAPSYTSYYGAPSYSSFYGAGGVMAPMAGCCGGAAPIYAASYGSYGAGCCTNSCCDSCGSSGCASGSCVATEPVGSLKPATDPISNKPKPTYDDEPRSRTFPADTDPAPTRGRSLDSEIDPLDKKKTDMFDVPEGGIGSDSDIEKGLNRANENFELRGSRKPAVDDPLDGTAIDPIEKPTDTPTDDKTFIGEPKADPNTTSRQRNTVLARTSSLSEVLAPKRLASRSMPSTTRNVSSSQVAGKADGQKGKNQTPLRWISAPLPTGHVSL